jgi:hypothetical protein
MGKGVTKDELDKMSFQDRMKYINDLEMMKKNISNIINEKIEAVIESQKEENDDNNDSSDGEDDSGEGRLFMSPELTDEEIDDMISWDMDEWEFEARHGSI